jgi:hypothetical protein
MPQRKRPPPAIRWCAWCGDTLRAPVSAVRNAPTNSPATSGASRGHELRQTSISPEVRMQAHPHTASLKLAGRASGLGQPFRGRAG